MPSKLTRTSSMQPLMTKASRMSSISTGPWLAPSEAADILAFRLHVGTTGKPETFRGVRTTGEKPPIDGTAHYVAGFGVDVRTVPGPAADRREEIHAGQSSCRSPGGSAAGAAQQSDYGRLRENAARTDVTRAKDSSKRKRRWPGVTDPIYKPYVVAIGQLALAWNELHESLALLFIELPASGRPYPATDIWNAVGFDRPKRQLIRSLLRALHAEYPAKPRMKADLEWFLTEIDKVEDARNDAIHAPLTFEPKPRVQYFMSVTGGTTARTKIVPSTAFDNRRALKLLNKELLTEFRWCRDMSIALSKHASEIYDAIAANPRESNAWPARPTLPNRGGGRKRADKQRSSRASG